MASMKIRSRQAGSSVGAFAKIYLTLATFGIGKKKTYISLKKKLELYFQKFSVSTRMQ